MILLFIAFLVISLAVLYYFFPILKVEGDSMYPTLKEGEYLLACRVFDVYDMKIGHVYVFRSPVDKNRYLIKRLKNEACIEQRRLSFYFLGDNLGNSYDSRNFGFVDQSAVIAKVIFPKKLLKQED